MLAAFLINIFALAMPIFTMKYMTGCTQSSVETLGIAGSWRLPIVIGDFVCVPCAPTSGLASQRVDLKLHRASGARIGVRLRIANICRLFASNLRSFETY